MLVVKHNCGGTVSKTLSQRRSLTKTFSARKSQEADTVTYARELRIASQRRIANQWPASFRFGTYFSQS